MATKGTWTAGMVLACAVLLGCSESSRRSAPSSSTSTTSATTSSTPTATTSSSTAPPVSQTPINSGTFKALIYNVAGLPQGLSSSNPIANTPQISPKLNNYDLVLVQEDFTYHTDLARDALHPFQSPPLTGYATLVNDGLNRFSQSKFTNLTRTKWAACNGWIGAANDCLSSKGFSFARHEVAPGVEIDVYNLHADAGGDSKDEDAREIQFDQLATFIIANSGNRAVIVGGDTNLKDRRPRDAQVLADFMNRCSLQEVAKVLGHPDIIDRFLFKSGARVQLTPQSYRVATEFVDPSGGDLSDHPAINVDFGWRVP